MAKPRFAFLVVLLVMASLASVSAMESRTNPIRKVVNMLQAMQKKVTDEAKKAEELFDKFVCYCKNADQNVEQSIQEVDSKVKELKPNTEALKSKKSMTEKSLKQKLMEREEAQRAMDTASAIRAKEHAEFEKEFGEGQENNKMLDQAIRAIQKGMDSSFLQTQAASMVKTYLMKNPERQADHQDLLSFLSGEEGSDYSYSPQNVQEVTGILKEMKYELDVLQKREDENAKTYSGLMMAKNREVHALSKAIQDRQDRMGKLGVDIAQKENDIDDSEDSVQEDSKFYDDLKKDCHYKISSHDLEMKARNREIIAIAETIKLLNDDEAMKLFKKTLPDSSASFLQLQTTVASMRARAKMVVDAARARAAPGDSIRLDFVSLALSGRKSGLDKVITLIDKYIKALRGDQVEDEQKYAYCIKELDVSEARIKELKGHEADLGVSMAESKEGISSISAEIKSLRSGIKALDSQVGDATAQRKEEHFEFRQLLANNAKAKELILFAKKKLNQFYNPEAAAKAANKATFGGFLQRSDDTSDQPADATEAYIKASRDRSNGVMQMMDMLIKELDDEVAQSRKDETDSQKEYEQLMADSANKRAADLKSVSDKGGNVADLKNQWDIFSGEMKADELQEMAAAKFVGTLHADCDLLIEYFETRKEARSDEIDALEKAKAVLSDADDLSLVQRAVKIRKTKVNHLAHD